MRKPKKIFVSSVFFLLCACGFAQIQIEKVLPNKIVYYTNEKGNISVEVNNNTGIDFKGKIVCELSHLLDKRMKIYEKEVFFKLGKNDITINFRTGSEEYGFEVTVSLLDEKGRQLSCRSEYFSVADNIWKVAIGGRTIKRPQKPVTPYIVLEEKNFVINPEGDREMAFLTRSAYINWYEFYAWAPDDFFELSPDGGEDEKWLSATGYYLMSKRKIRSIIEGYKSQGIRCISYAQPYAVGNATYEFLRKKPEWFIYNKYGQPEASFNVASLEFLKEKTQKQDFSVNPRLIGLGGEQAISLNHALAEVTEYGIEEVVKSAKMFGWDGVRWDNSFYSVPKKGYDFYGRPISSYGDYDEISARAVSLIRKKLWQEISPKFAIGYNDDPKALVPTYPKAHAEACKDGQLCISEVFNRKFSLPDARWKEMVDYIKEDIRYVHSLGGHYMVVGLNPSNQTARGIAQSYMQILIFATRAHPYHGHWFVYDDPEITGSYSQFMTRYSAFIWDIEKVKNIKNPEEVFQVRSAKEIWWKEWACERKDKEEYQLILHLINPPPCEIISRTDKAPEVLKDIEVSAVRPMNHRTKNVYLLTAEPVTKKELVPFRETGERIEVRLPELKIWSILVFDFEKR